jgi:hypothetical protein
VVFDPAYNLIAQSKWLNMLISVLIPVAEIDRRLAGINHFRPSTGDGSGHRATAAQLDPAVDRYVSDG